VTEKTRGGGESKIGGLWGRLTDGRGEMSVEVNTVKDHTLG